MKTITRYLCSKCNREYDVPEMAERCEKLHGDPIKVRRSTTYSHLEENNLPARVEVLMDNGRVAEYRYFGELVPDVWKGD